MDTEVTITERIAMLSRFLTPRRLQRMHHVLSYRTRYITLVLEDIYQSHNASAVLRSCDAFGIQDVHVLQNHNIFSPNPEVSLGSSKWLNLHRYSQTPTPKVYDSLRKRGYKIVATALQEDALPPDTLEVNKSPIALVFGNELNGLSKEAISSADETTCIPMVGFVESFNISVSVAIILSQLIPKMRKLGSRWHLNEKDAQQVLLDWLRISVHRSEEIEQSVS